MELAMRKNDAQSILISAVYFSYTDTYSCFMSNFMIIAHVQAYDKESCTLLVPSMMSSQFVQQSESLSVSYELQKFRSCSSWLLCTCDTLNDQLKFRFISGTSSD